MPVYFALNWYVLFTLKPVVLDAPTNSERLSTPITLEIFIKIPAPDTKPKFSLVIILPIVVLLYTLVGIFTNR